MPAKDVENGRMVVTEPQSKNSSKPLVNTTITVECKWLYSGGGDITCGKDEQWFPRRTCSPSDLCTVMHYELCILYTVLYDVWVQEGTLPCFLLGETH